MKKFLPFLSLAIVAAACNTSPDLAQKDATGAYLTAPAQPSADTAGLAEYQNWKAQNELAELDIQDETEMDAPAPAKKVASKPKTVAKAPVRKAATSTAARKPVAQTPPPVKQDNTSGSEGTTGNSTAGTGNGSGTGSGSEGTGTEVAKKEGMSKAAKGAIIGGVGGAVGGAVINKKNRAAGAVIGAVLGAGGGYVIGRKMDQKDGRIE